jgi:hypothetical protein
MNGKIRFSFVDRIFTMDYKVFTVANWHNLHKLISPSCDLSSHYVDLSLLMTDRVKQTRDFGNFIKSGEPTFQD